MVNKYETMEQAETYAMLYQNLIDIDNEVEGLKSQPKVFQVRIAMQALAEDIPAYEDQVPEDVREQLGFDVDGLAQKLSHILSHQL